MLFSIIEIMRQYGTQCVCSVATSVQFPGLGSYRVGYGIELVTIGIVLFASVALFQLITLPVELNASRRPYRLDRGILDQAELNRTKRVYGCCHDVCCRIGAFNPFAFETASLTRGRRVRF